MAVGFDVEITEALAEWLADEAGRGDAFRAEAGPCLEFQPTRIEFGLAAHRLLEHARRFGLEMVRGR